MLDTNAVIDFFNGNLPSAGRQLLLAIEPVISVITHIELFSSPRLTPAEVAQLQQFIQLATVYATISPEIVNQTIAIRLRHKVKTPDAIIAATALVNRLPLITRNVADFREVVGFQVINPHSIV